jgi:hypothetical protein
MAHEIHKHFSPTNNDDSTVVFTLKVLNPNLMSLFGRTFTCNSRGWSMTLNLLILNEEKYIII